MYILSDHQIMSMVYQYLKTRVTYQTMEVIIKFSLINKATNMSCQKILNVFMHTIPVKEDNIKE